MHNHAYPRDYSDRQLLESIWRKIDGLAAMLGGPIRHAHELAEDIDYVVQAWTPPKPSRDET